MTGHPSWACLRAVTHADGSPTPLTPADLAARWPVVGPRARVVEAESLADLAQATGDGVVVLYVNAGVLWADPLAVEWGEANHCVLARGLTDAGAVIDDPARPTAATVPPDVLVSAWLNTGGRMLVAG